MSSVEIVSALERRLNASIPQQAIRTHVTARLKDIAKTAKVAGFRPGKVPAKVIGQQYGAQVHQEALGDALQRSFHEATLTNKLRVAGYPQFDVKTKDLSADQIEYSAVFEVYPEVVMGNLSGETIERKVYELTQADVDSTIATLRKQRVTFDMADRAAQAEDQVRIDFIGKLNGEPFKGGEGKDYPVVLGMGNMLPEFEAAMFGMKAGETKSFDLTFPENYHGKDVAGKQVTFTITLHSVGAPKLPALDAEFAKSVGIEDGDVTKLEEEVKSNLTREVTRRLNARNKDTAMDALLKVAKFDAPKALLEWESQSLMEQTVKDMESRGMKMKGVPLPSELFAERAEKRVKLGLILAEVVEKQALHAKPEQVKALIQDYAKSFDRPDEVIRWYASDAKRRQEVENLVLEENVVEWAMSQANTTDKAVTFKELMGDA
ncbi:MAG: trigger factor [Gallionella sp.]